MTDKILNQIQQLHHLNLSDTVFVFQANRIFTLPEMLGIEKKMNDFVISWTSHQSTVHAQSTIILGQFLIFIINENSTQLGGCSKDSLVRFIKNTENELNISLLNRQLLAFLINDKVQIVPYNQVHYAFEQKKINTETLFFNNLINNVEQLKQQWLIPIKSSWLNNQLLHSQKNY